MWLEDGSQPFWIDGPILPQSLHGSQGLVTSDSKTFLLIGGWKDGKDLVSTIYQFRCSNKLCSWMTRQSLQVARSHGGAILLPSAKKGQQPNTIELESNVLAFNGQPECYDPWSWIGDGICDDGMNLQECLFDGGDCCAWGRAECSFCESCICHVNGLHVCGLLFVFTLTFQMFSLENQSLLYRSNM